MSADPTKKPMTLARAEGIAARVLDQLGPLCDRIEVAGSIRRRLPEVNDVDIVLLPKPGASPQIRARVAARCRVQTDGEQCLRAWLDSGEMLDIWRAHHREEGLFEDSVVPGNFGTLLLCRTGSLAFNRHLAIKAAHRGYHWNPHHGLYDNNGPEPVWLAGEHAEEEIFTALGMDFIPPEKR